MDIESILSNKDLKPKQRTEEISKALNDGQLSIDQLLAYASGAKDPKKASCIEAVEFVSQQKPEIVTEEFLDFVHSQLGAKAPRVVWESSKVIGNSIQLHKEKVDELIPALLVNTKHPGTVVRWSTAYALTQIARLRLSLKVNLIEKMKEVEASEEKNSIKKIYQKALKELA